MIVAAILLAVSMLPSCVVKEFHIISDEEFLNQVHVKFESRKELASNRAAELFDVFKQDLSPVEIEGMKFLYAYMPLNDLADYDGDFFLKHVRASLAARDTFAWGPDVPEAEFRHFVLPYRVNNENLDTARLVFFNELKDRIRHLDMLEAALEVNHWCHEKVTYRGADIRTSSPLASVRTAFGRCGEESTFTVAALRSVGIPARQVYTPRWAHSDDNHAWVEFWAQGEWHYMGACEPEAVANYGWFTEPARRAMLVHTKAFGNYKGTERVTNNEENYALLNTLGVYAQTHELTVHVLNADKSPVKDAIVEFQLYNYAEFYPIAILKTDEDGYCSFFTGLGDLLVWAYHQDKFDFEKISVGITDTVSLVLDNKDLDGIALDLDLVPPIEREPYMVSQLGKDENNRRLQEEDSIRTGYEDSFMDEDQVNEFADNLGLQSDELWSRIRDSRGNYSEIIKFLKTADKEQLSRAMKLLGQVSQKDLRDTKSEILMDHLTASYSFMENQDYPMELFEEYVLNPRVDNEMLVSYRHLFQEAFSGGLGEEIRNDPEKLVSWFRDSIRIEENENYYQTPLTPVGCYQLKISDQQSRDIMCIAVYRSLAIPSRMEPGTLLPQYWFDNQWNTIYFDKKSYGNDKKAWVKLIADPNNPVNPKYLAHFTLAQFRDGKYHTLMYGWDTPIDELDKTIELNAGGYMLVTGNRQPGGMVLNRTNFFTLKPGDKRDLNVVIRTNTKNIEPLGKISLNREFENLLGGENNIDVIAGAGNIIMAWLDPDKEPTKHAIKDLGELKAELNKLPCRFIFILPKDKITDSFSLDDLKDLPEQSSYLKANDLNFLEEIENVTGKSLKDHFPVFLLVNIDGQITYLSSGYKIGIAEEIIKQQDHQKK